MKELPAESPFEISLLQVPPNTAHLHAVTACPWEGGSVFCLVIVPNTTRVLLERKQGRMDVGLATCSPCLSHDSGRRDHY